MRSMWLCYIGNVARGGKTAGFTGEACAIAQCGERLSTKEPEKELSWPTRPGSGSANWGQGQLGGGFPSSLLKYLWNIKNKYVFFSFYFSSPDVKIWLPTSY